MLAWLVGLFESICGHSARLLSVRGVKWVATQAAVAGVTLARPEDVRKIKEEAYGFCTAWVLELTGLSLDKSDPFSDASLCNALNEKTGMALRTVKDKESIRVDVEHWALAKLEEKTGLHIRNIRDKRGVIKDVMRFASPVVADATGLPLSDLSDVDKTKSEVGNYLQDRALVLLSHDIERAKTLVRGAMESVGMTVESFVERVVKKGGIDPVTGQPNVKIDAEMVVLGVLSRALIQAAARRKTEEDERNKASRRTEQRRAALKRFRVKHGSRMKYERV